MTRSIVIGAGIGLVGVTAFAASRFKPEAAPAEVRESVIAKAERAQLQKRHDATFAADLASTDVRVRRVALREAAESGAVDTPSLLEASRDPDLEVAIVATGALGGLYARGQLAPGELIAIGRNRSVHEKVRATAFSALGSIPTREGGELLAEMLARGDLLERRIASGMLRNQYPAIAAPALIDALSDSDEHVRSQALDSLRAHSRGHDFGADAAAWRAWWSAR